MPSSAPSTPSASVVPSREVVSRSAESSQPLEFTRENLQAAGRKFADFFSELGENMIEREDDLESVALALLSEKPLLMLGHPGTAKTGLAELALKQFVDDEGNPSVFEVKFQVETRRGEVQGPKLPGIDPDGKAVLYHLKELGVGSKKLGIIDEVFDGPPAIVRGTLLDILQGYLVDSGKREPIDMECLLAASNKTIEELRAKYGNELDAIFDRFAFIFWTIKRPLRDDTGEKIMGAEGKRQIEKRSGSSESGLKTPPIHFKELDLLREAVKHVYAKMVKERWAIRLGAKFYKAFHQKMDSAEQELGGMGRSRLESMRTQNVILDLLPAIAVLRYIRNPNTPLAVIPDDFLSLKYYLTMRGPIEADIPDETTLEAQVGDDEDRKFLGRLRIENRAFKEIVEEVLEPAKSELRRRAPVNFSHLLGMIQIAESVLRNQAASESEVHDCLNAMPVTISDINEASTHEPKGEEVLAKGVEIFLGLLKKKAETTNKQEDIQSAKTHFRELRPYIDSLLNSFYRSSIEKGVELFKEAIQEAHLRLSAHASALSEIMEILDEVARDEDILGGETIGTIRELVKGAALNHALSLAAAGQTQDIEQACGELQKIIDLKALLGDEGMDGKVPLDKVIEIHGKALARLKWILEAMQKIVPTDTGSDEQDLRRMLDQVNNLLAQYEQSLKQDDLGARRGDQLPEQGIQEYLEFKKSSKQRGKGKKGVSLKGEVAGKENGKITIAWYRTSTKNEPINATEWKAGYEAHCREKMFDDPVELTKTPQIRALLDRILLLGEVAFGKSQWNDELQEVVRQDLLDVIIGVAKSGADGTFEWAIQPGGRNITAMPIRADLVSQAMSTRLEAVKQDEESLKEFLTKKGIQATTNNLDAIRSVLSAAATATGTNQQKVSIETTETETEEVTAGEITKFLTEKERVSWAVTHGEISRAVSELGTLIADRLVEDRLAALGTASSSAGGAMDVASFIEKYNDFFSASPVGGQASTALAPWKHLPINLGTQGKVGTILEADLAATLSALSLKPKDDLEGKLVGPLGALASFLQSLTGVNTGPLMKKVEEEKQQKVEQWVKARIEHYTQIGQDIHAMVGQEAQVEQKVSILKQSIEHLIQSLREEARTLAANVGDADKERILQEGDNILVTLVTQAAEQIEQLEMSSTGFKMQDLKGTLDQTNRGEVEDWMGQHKFFKTTEGLVEAAKTYFAARPSAASLVKGIEQKESALSKLKGEYLGRVRELAGSAI